MSGTGLLVFPCSIFSGWCLCASQKTTGGHVWSKHTVKTNYHLLKLKFETVKPLKTTDPKQPTFRIFF